LIVRDPSAAADVTRGTVVDRFTENVDVAPTILDLSEMANSPPQFEGCSLMRFIRFVFVQDFPLFRSFCLLSVTHDLLVASLDWCCARLVRCAQHDCIVRLVLCAQHDCIVRLVLCAQHDCIVRLVLCAQHGCIVRLVLYAQHGCIVTVVLYA
jgi:hypothetical protein